jgi:hypothetical protein
MSRTLEVKDFDALPRLATIYIGQESRSQISDVDKREQAKEHCSSPNDSGCEDLTLTRK